MPKGKYIHNHHSSTEFKKGHKVPQKWKKIISITHKGKKNPKHSEWMKKQIGEKSPNWKGGITKLTKKIRESPKYQTWKILVLKRDFPNLNPEQIKKERIQVHHLIQFKKIIEDYNIQTLKEAEKCDFLWNINNGVSLRKGEHYLVSQLERYKYPSKGFILMLEKMIKQLKEIKWQKENQL